MANWIEYIITTGTVAAYGVIVLIAAVVFGLLGWWIYRLIAYNKKVVIREITGGARSLIHTDWAKEFKSKKTGAYYWRLKKRKHVIPKPPPQALDITKGGKLWVELYYTGQGQYVPATAPKTDFSKDREFTETFQPITESQRACYVDQIEKSYSYKQKGVSDIVREAVPYIALVMIIAVFLLFLGEGMKPILEQARIAQQGSQDFMKASEIMSEAVRQLRGIQVIGGVTANSTVVPPD